MQKKLIISVVALVSLYVYVFVSVNINLGGYTEQFKFLNDNQIKVYNKFGFKTAEMEKIENIDGVTNADFTNTLAIANYYIELDDMYSDYALKEAFGIVIPENSTYQQQLNYIEGTYLTANNQVILSERLAKGIMEVEGYAKLADLIGEEFGSNLEIVGIYQDDLKKTSEEAFNNYYFTTSSEEVAYTNSFYTFNQSQSFSKEYIINTINNEQVYSDQNLNAGYVATKCPEEPYYPEVEFTNENYYLVKTTLYSDGCTIDYQANVDNGMVGLIDPNTTEYGEEFNQYLLLTVNEEQKQAVIGKLKEQFPDAAIIANDTTFREIEDLSSGLYTMAGAMIVIALALYLPRIKFKKQ